MKILVTGGAGFVGSHLCEELSKNKNYNIVSLDNYFNGSSKNHVKGVEYIKGETKDIEKHISEIPDIIYHLGEYSRVLTSFDEIDLVLRYNILGTYNVLEFARKNKIRIIYSASSTKFGDHKEGEAKNQSPYAWTKVSNVDLIKNYGKWFGLNYAITYFYNVYGGREVSIGKYATLIGLFSQKFKNNKPLTVVAPGTQKRAFTHVDDIVRGLILVGKKGKGDGYCIGFQKSYSILEIAEFFGKKIIMLPSKKGDRLSSAIDLSKMESLGWIANKDVKDYIRELINNY